MVSLLLKLGVTYNAAVGRQDAGGSPTSVGHQDAGSSSTSWTKLEGLGVAYTNSDHDKGYQLTFTVEATQESGGPSTLFFLIGGGLGRALPGSPGESYPLKQPVGH
jgi:hypothetical protein